MPINIGGNIVNEYYVKSFGYKNIITRGLVAYYDAGVGDSYNGSGVGVRNVVNGISNASLTNGAGYSSSDGGKFTFDGVDDFVTISELNYTLSQPWTVEMVLKIHTGDPTHWNGIFGGVPDTSYGGGYWFFHAGQLGFYHSYTPNVIIYYTGLSMGNQIPYDVFTHLTIRFVPTATPSTTGNFYVYVNGTLSASATPLTWDTGKTYSTRIPMFGGTQAGRYGNSDFSIFKVYNRALEEIEITQSYTSLKKRFSI
jgi:hypothetical protein